MKKSDYSAIAAGAFRNLIYKGEGYRQVGGEIPGGYVFEAVDHYLEHAFWIGINPLTGLRKCFPDFIWEYHRFPEETEIGRELLEVLKKSDFFWPMPNVSSCKWVTMREKNIGNRAPLCMCGTLNESNFYDSSGRSKWFPDELDAFMSAARKKMADELPPLCEERVKWEKLGF